uniref:non-specific serine/threonine protein kinase n=1 Tax=Lygus hesperus TaxID=30085 RepID=A0A0A9VZT3_LYGHE
MKQNNGSAQNNGLLSVDEETLESIIKNEPITNVYDVEHTPFARGKFAAVRKLVHKVTGVAYAGKFIRKRRRSMDQRQEILHEVAVLRLAAQSRRIVNLLEVYETPTEMALVLELAAGGELQRVVDIQDGLEESEAIVVMKQVLEALKFLHDLNIAHLDLKPQNMLLTRDYPDTNIVLCDFGISRVIQDGVEVREILGTPDYVAPEVLSYEPISLATDVWSVGVLAYVLLSGYSPFAGDTKQQTFCNISQCTLSFPPELFDSVSPAALHFIRSTLVTDPRCRLSAEECLNHPWLTGEPMPQGPLEPELSGLTPSATAPFLCLACAKCGSSGSCHHDIAGSPVVEIIHDRGIIC